MFGTSHPFTLSYTQPQRIIIRIGVIFKYVWSKRRINEMNLEQIQQALRSEGFDGWLFYDFRKSNPIAYQVLSIPLNSFFSRRWFYFIPVKGTPVALVSAVESHVLHAL